MASLKAIARLAGSGGGVSTLNGLSGTISLTSIGGTVIITPSGSTINLESTGGVGAVSSVSNSDGSLTISPTTGAVVGSLNTAHANTWTANQTFNNEIILATTTDATHGVIYQSTNPFLHSFGTDNLFLGANAGNFTLTGFNNVGIGSGSLSGATSASFNTAIGKNTMIGLTTGIANVAIGNGALASVTGGAGSNTAIGDAALFTYNGSGNTAIGALALFNANSSASQCTAIGNQALFNLISGAQNIAIGDQSGVALTTGSGNTLIGISCLSTSQIATNNVCLGLGAMQFTPVGSGASENMAIGHNAMINVQGNSNVGIGNNAGSTAAANYFCTFIGSDTNMDASTVSFNGNYATAIGYGAKVKGSNIMSLGGENGSGFEADIVIGARLVNNSRVQIYNNLATKIGLIVNGFTSQSADLQQWQDISNAVLAKVDSAGNFTAASLIKTGGTSSQFLKADGSVDSTVYATAYYTWSAITTSLTLVKGNAYIANSGSLIIGTLPTTAAVGDRFRVTGQGAGLFKIAQNASQSIRFGSLATTSGTGGSLTATDIGDDLEILCITANTGFKIISSIGNITIV